MLSEEIIKANESLATLTDEQVQAIVTLSKNDEDTVVGNKVSEIYNTFDEKVKRLTNIDRESNEKTYDYFERAVASVSNDAQSHSRKASDLQKEVTRLTKALAEGADAEVAKQLKQAKSDLESVRKQYTDLQGQLQNKETEYKSALFGMQLDNEIAAVRGSIKFKESLPDKAVEMLLNQAIAGVKKLKADYIDNGNGGKAIAFFDESGAVLRNPEKQLEPYTAGDMLIKHLKDMDIIEVGRKQEGAGSGAERREQNNSLMLDISEARTKNEAVMAIKKQLIDRGMVENSNEYNEAMSKAWVELEVSKLPS